MRESEARTLPRCCCRLRVAASHPDTGELSVAYDQCLGRTSSPDDPICDACRGARHPEHRNFDPALH